jgi:hypothetical protein
MRKTINIRDYFENNSNKYLILTGNLIGSITNFYPDAQNQMSDNKTWDFKTNPAIEHILSVTTFILLSQDNNQIGTHFYNVQFYEKIGISWIVEIGVGVLTNDILHFTFANGLNGKITRSKCNYKVERFIYAKQDVYSGSTTVKTNALVDKGTFNMTSNTSYFETTTGYTLRPL